MSDEPERRELADELRARACPAGLPHTGDDPASDHGHTDCWLFHRAADQIEALETRLDDSWYSDIGQRYDEAVTRITELDNTMAAMAEEQTEIVSELKARIRELEVVERRHVAQHLDMLANEQIPRTEDHTALTRAAELLRKETPAPEAVAQIARLERWKAEAMVLLNVWDKVHDALGSPAELGESKAAASLREAEHLMAELTAWRDQEPLSPDPERVQMVNLIRRNQELEQANDELETRVDAEYQRGWRNGLAYGESRDPRLP